MYEARAICNLLIASKKGVSPALTNLRINKLLYFIHGWSFRREDRGLIRNHFEAWPLGPVVRSVFEEFARYGEKEIIGPAEYLDYATGKWIPVSFDSIAANHVNLIEKIAHFHDQYTTAQLVQMSHLPDGPWAHAWASRQPEARLGGRISNEEIRAHFVGDGCAYRNH